MPYSELKIVGPFTTTERDALVNVPPDWIIKNSTTGQFEFWTGSAWQTVPSNSPTFVTATAAAGVFTTVAVSTSVETPHLYVPSVASEAIHLQNNAADFAVPTTILRRFQEQQDVSVASANNLALGTGGNVFEITGTTQINLLAATSWNVGSTITLLFTSTPTVKHGQAASGNNFTILLSGGVDFIAAAGDRLVLELCDISAVRGWREVSRALVAATQTYTETNVTTDRSFDANATSLDEIADVLGSLIADLRAKRIVL